MKMFEIVMQLKEMDYHLESYFNHTYQVDNDLFNVSVVIHIVYSEILRELPKGQSINILNY